MLSLPARVAARGARGVATRVEADGTDVTNDPIPVTASRVINIGDNGAVLVPNATLTLTIPDNLPDGFSFRVAPITGTTSIARSGTATLNGAGTTITRASTNIEFAVRKTSYEVTPETYIVTGT